ncbi:MAG: helix-turn-helix transcriptional regulator [Lachnospiraceae bacterium]|nr:helix-turn-helix transcriptional regulator [Lachnospiraceae bacterium]
MVYKRIRNLREDHDLTQTVLAAYLNISQRAYSRYETGERQIPTEALVKLADYYDTSVDYLLNRTDSLKKYPAAKK